MNVVVNVVVVAVCRRGRVVVARRSFHSYPSVVVVNVVVDDELDAAVGLGSIGGFGRPGTSGIPPVDTTGASSSRSRRCVFVEIR